MRPGALNQTFCVRGNGRTENKRRCTGAHAEIPLSGEMSQSGKRVADRLRCAYNPEEMKILINIKRGRKPLQNAMARSANCPSAQPTADCPVMATTLRTYDNMVHMVLLGIVRCAAYRT